MMGGRSPGRTLGPFVAGPAGLDDGLAVGEETGTGVAEGVGDDLAAPPLQAVATNVTTTSRAAKPIRMGKYCLIAPTPHPR
jgi:hypothetical protein